MTAPRRFSVMGDLAIGAPGATSIAATRQDAQSIQQAPATSLRDFDANVCIAQDTP